MMAVAAAFSTLVVNAAEVSLLNTFKWVRWGERSQVVWHERDGKREVTLIRAPGEKMPSISSVEVDLADVEKI